MAKVHPIIEYQEDIQRTPEELVKHLQSQVKDWKPDRIVVLLWKEDLVQYIPASNDREFSNAKIFWDVTGWLKVWREDCD